MAILSRDEIDEKYHWDLSGMCADDDTFLQLLQELKQYPEKITAFRGTLAQGADRLLGYLRLADEVSVLIGRLFNYAQRKNDEDTRIAKYQDFCAQIMSAAVAVSSAGAWFTPELLTLTDEQMARYYADCPDLELYRRNLDILFRRRAHTLSPTEEALLASAQEMASAAENIYSVFSDADLTFPPALDANGEAHEVTHGSLGVLEQSTDRVLRQNAYESLYSVIRQFRNTAAGTLAAQCKQLKFFADARHYPSTLAAALDDNEVPVEVYTNLIEAVHRNLPALHRYIALRKKLLGVDELRFSDIYAPMVGDVEMSFTFEEACDICLKALEPMGEDYLALVRKAFSERWIDVYENPGKRSGAYSAGGYGMTPVMLLNFHGTLDDVFTLIHETGHSIHTYLTCSTQPPCYSSYVIFVAEVASTCNEALLMQYLLKVTTDKRRRAYLLNHYMEQFKGTLYRQCMFAEFELKINQIVERGEGLTAEVMTELYRDLNRQYYGDEIVTDDNIAAEWARIPHFYYNYYVYQYATGYAAAIALSQRILKEGAPAVRDYVNFLKGGSSASPIDLLRGAGVDMASTAPIDAALQVFSSVIDEMESLMA